MQKTLLTIFFFAIVSLFIYSGTNFAPSEITVNPGETYQTILGWEAVAQAGQIDCPGFDNYKNALFDDAVDNLGINRLRVPINAVSDTSISFNMTAFDRWMRDVVIPIRSRLLARGETLFVNVNFARKSGFPSQPDMSAYAQEVLKTYQYMDSNYGFIPDGWEVVLEPGLVSPGWTPAIIDDAIIRTHQLLSNNGYPSNYFIAPSSFGGPDNALSTFNSMLSANSGVLPTGLGEFSYHRYGNATQTMLQDVADLRGQYGINTAMLEHTKANYDELHADLGIANVSAWQQFALAYCVSSDNGDQYYVVSGDSFSIGSRTKFLRQYFKFIRSGAVRIGSSSTNSSFDPVSFVNPDGHYVVVIKASQAGPFAIQGLPAGTYGIKYTTNSQYNVDLNDISIQNGQLLNSNIPEAGVITIYQKSGDTQPATSTPTSTSGIPEETPVTTATLSPMKLTPQAYIPMITKKLVRTSSSSIQKLDNKWERDCTQTAP
jgi:hypothetical protein